MGVCERYHEPLRRIFKKIVFETPSISPLLALSSACKAMNDTMGPEGFVPTLLVYGMLPRIPIGDQATTTPNQAARMKALSTARSEMEEICANLRLKTAETHDLPPTLLDMQPSPGMQVLVFRRKTQVWEGPYELDRIDGKSAYVKISEGLVQPFSVSRVKPFRTPVESALRKNDNQQTSDEVTSTSAVNYTKVLSPRDVTDETIEEFRQAISDEMNGLFEQKTFKKVLKENIPEGANVLRSRFVFAIKDVGTPSERKKARLVAMGHTDKMKRLVLSDAPTLMRYALRILISVAVMYDLELYSRDVKQAYLQSETPMQRDIYIYPPRGQRKDEEKYLYLLQKPLYGITESGSYWVDTYMSFFENDLQMEHFLLDPCFMYKRKCKTLEGMVGMIVDDTIGAGTKSFIQAEDQKCRRFSMNPKKRIDFDFSGMHIKQGKTIATLDQKHYASSINGIMLENPQKELFVKIRGQLAWCAHSTRPDLAFYAARLAQVKRDEFTRDDVKLLRRATRMLKQKAKVLKYHKLDPSSASLAVYTDASFATNKDLSSQLGFVVLLTDASKKCALLHWNSYKSHRVTRSVLGSEVYAFCDGMDVGISFQLALEPILGRKVNLNMYTDSKSLFDTIITRSQTSEKRLLIDISSVREAYRKKEISNVAWVRSEYNLADALTKESKENILNSVLETWLLNHPVEQWIIR